MRECCPGARAIFDCNDLHSVRLKREAEVKGDAKIAEEARVVEEMENRLFAKTDATIAISREEEEKIRARSPTARTLVLLSNIHETKAPTRSFSERSGILFVGHYLHAPNVDAVKFFVGSIFGKLRARIPDAEFLVVGSNVTSEVQALEGDGVRVIGYVPDLEPIFEKSRVFVAPLRFGAGVKGKIGQSMGMGLTCCDN